ncbi:PTS sugar transporter subunit IIA [Marinomonas mediterranea]|jgi:Phosphotransferase system mannitol/fructose-specific IIA domain (Ntr-type)|uniref:Putative PTS IIA-like nitrogen-regulatory protein PtsN n=1 Tax=Marinomonas mediterranea (strain ATCC 700492 / JCM 21426 / NBRC 103028 / MMB-1) TaxID=717774 RepID=F2K199_MARM1|nr:PTS sugar transporter subunit IIA [Marinomonas mediterranea]ADZ91030.1 putative PTS IIA-like nitrogen-regulatory protein PtsN [Marinomonas mediterranea MMB-1]WCN09067.1 PTS transporter subunit EIIA [Marinomonas mediterranea]WCN13098.1 PTS transporter subunit EIIA [Marinomonas mediterranea]WCN17169.1 PTS transporter subunit EIIA [Marinomonas mediterranea MMB-1]
MSLEKLVNSELVFANQPIASKKRVLEFLAEAIGARLHCESEAVYDALLAREKLGSTGVGAGIAIPHCRFEQANHAALVVMSLEKPIDYDSIDRQPVDLIFALIAPPNECEGHLKTLSQIAEMAQSPDKLKRLRDTTTNEELITSFLQQV